MPIVTHADGSNGVHLLPPFFSPSSSLFDFYYLFKSSTFLFRLCFNKLLQAPLSRYHRWQRGTVTDLLTACLPAVGGEMLRMFGREEKREKIEKLGEREKSETRY